MPSADRSVPGRKQGELRAQPGHVVHDRGWLPGLGAGPIRDRLREASRVRLTACPALFGYARSEPGQGSWRLRSGGLSPTRRCGRGTSGAALRGGGGPQGRCRSWVCIARLSKEMHSVVRGVRRRERLGLPSDEFGTDNPSRSACVADVGLRDRLRSNDSGRCRGVGW